MNIIQENKIENSICALWQDGQSLRQIGKVLNIKFTFKNKATGQDIPISDTNRTIINKLMGWEDLTKTFTDTLN